MDTTSPASASPAHETVQAQPTTVAETASVKNTTYSPPVMQVDNIPVEMKCPGCKKRIKTAVVSRLTDDARFASGCFCCFGCLPSIIMNSSDEFKVNRHHCTNCGIEIGSIVTTAHPDGTQTFRVLSPEEAKAAEPKVFST